MAKPHQETPNPPRISQVFVNPSCVLEELHSSREGHDLGPATQRHLAEGCKTWRKWHGMVHWVAQQTKDLAKVFIKLFLFWKKLGKVENERISTLKITNLYIQIPIHDSKNDSRFTIYWISNFILQHDYKWLKLPHHHLEVSNSLVSTHRKKWIKTTACWNVAELQAQGWGQIARPSVVLLGKKIDVCITGSLQKTLPPGN